MKDVIKEYLVTVETTNDENAITTKIMHEDKEIKFKREKSVVSDDEESVGSHPITYENIYGDPVNIPLYPLEDNVRRGTKKSENEIRKPLLEKIFYPLKKSREKVADAENIYVDNPLHAKTEKSRKKAQGGTKNRRLGGRKKTLRKKILRKN